MTTQFTDAAKLAAFLADDPEVETRVNAEIAKKRLVTAMIKARVQKGWNQRQMANAMKCTPSRICRLESSTDENLRMGDVIAYFQALGMGVDLLLNDKSLPVAARIKHCVLRTDALLKELAGIAQELNGETEVVDKIHQFYGEVLFNFLTRFSDRYENLLSVIQVSESPEGTSVSKPTAELATGVAVHA
jgi:transcriptional regulator with XRE-family HTH domain